MTMRCEPKAMTRSECMDALDHCSSCRRVLYCVGLETCQNSAKLCISSYITASCLSLSHAAITVQVNVNLSGRHPHNSLCINEPQLWLSSVLIFMLSPCTHV